MPDRETLRVTQRDVLIAAACAGLSIVLILVSGVYFWQIDDVMAGAGQLGIASVILIAQSAVILARRVNPVACFAVIAALQVVVVAVLPVGAGVRGVAAFVAAFTVGALLPIRPAVIVVLAVTVAETAGAAAVAASTEGVTAPGFVIEYGLSALLNYLALLLLGAFVIARRETAELSAERALEMAREQRERADRAVADERSRMARELHDIAAHHLSGMVVQASAVERLIDHDPEAAKTATRALRAQGKETLANLRTAVGMLRDRASTDGGQGLADRGGPVPGVGLLDELIAEVVRAGDRVRFAVTGDPRPLTPLADVAVYRVVQEALSNARQHAPGAPTRVTLEWAASALSVAIENDPPASRPAPSRRDGLGLVGMRERAELIGAELDAGPTPGGGWRVELTLASPAPAPEPAVHVGSISDEGERR